MAGFRLFNVAPTAAFRRLGVVSNQPVLSSPPSLGPLRIGWGGGGGGGLGPGQPQGLQAAGLPERAAQCLTS